MNANVGKTDRIVRIVLGVVVLLLGLILGSWWGLLGLIPLLTAALGWCPAYRLLGFSTCKPAVPRREAEAT